MATEHKPDMKNPPGPPKGSHNAQKENQPRDKRLPMRVTADDLDMINEVVEAKGGSRNDHMLDAIRPYFRRLKKKLNK